MYNIIDIKTGEVVAKRSTLKAACRLVDKLDNRFGGYRYVHKFVPESN